MIEINKILNMLFFDIETVTEYSNIDQFKSENEKLYLHWNKIFERYKSENQTLDENDAYLSYAPLYPEFSKVMSVSFGAVLYDKENDTYRYHIKSKADNDEKVILDYLSNAFNVMYSRNKSVILSGHNIIDFDIPFLIKRYVKHSTKLPELLKLTIDRKPWELNVFDSLKYWKFGGQKFTSLGMICDFMSIDSPKEELNGSMINKYYWNNLDNLDKIKQYNEGDIKSLIDLLLKLSKL